MKMIQKVKRLFHTSRYLKNSQLFHRTMFLGKRKIAYPFCLITMEHYGKQALKFPMVVKTSFVGLPSVDSFQWDTITKEEHHQIISGADSIKQNNFSFLNKEYTFSHDIGWNDPSLPHLWRYNLHYFEFALKLGCAWQLNPTEIEYYESFKRIILDWIRHNLKIGVGDGWHPYTVSLRLVHWTYASELFKPLLLKDEEFYTEFIKSYYIQAIFLQRNLEWDVLGNHLVENGRALVFAGLYLDHPDANELLNKGILVLWLQLQEQILSDGGHYERAPMYHQIVLRDYLEVIRILQLNHIAVPKKITNKLKDMLEFQNRILHPDGQIPLLNDSAFQIASSPATIRLFASSLGIGQAWVGDQLDKLFDRILVGQVPQAMMTVDNLAACFNANESGYYIYSHRNVYLIADAGQPSPDFLPAHAHADFGTYELSLYGKRWIVDSGVYEYQGDLRNKYRGTAAHNCLQVDKTNQTDVWGSFRMAKRAKPIEIRTDLRCDVWALKASHNGYQDKHVIPTRKFFIIEDLIIIIDEIISESDFVAESYIHFHPDVSITQEEDMFIATQSDHRIRLIPFGSAQLTIDTMEGSYSPEFGQQLPNKVIILSMNLRQGYAYLGYTMDLKGNISSCQWDSEYSCYIIETNTKRIEFQFNEMLYYQVYEK